MNAEQIEKLSPQERVAGYLALSAKLAEIGARLRTKHKDVATDYHEGWTGEEEAEWDACTDEMDAWFYAIKGDEWPVIKHVEVVLAPLTRAEWPIQIL